MTRRGWKVTSLDWERQRHDRYLDLTRDGLEHAAALAVLDRELPMAYRCQSCGRSFSTLNGIGRHTEKKHEGAA